MHNQSPYALLESFPRDTLNATKDGDILTLEEAARASRASNFLYTLIRVMPTLAHLPLPINPSPSSFFQFQIWFLKF
jgi:hypothetical protein